MLQYCLLRSLLPPPAPPPPFPFLESSSFFFLLLPIQFGSWWLLTRLWDLKVRMTDFFHFPFLLVSLVTLLVDWATRLIWCPWLNGNARCFVQKGSLGHLNASLIEERVPLYPQKLVLHVWELQESGALLVLTMLPSGTQPVFSSATHMHVYLPA